MLKSREFWVVDYLIVWFVVTVLDRIMIMIVIMNLYSAKTIEEYSKALYIKLKLMNK